MDLFELGTYMRNGDGGRGETKAEKAAKARQKVAKTAKTAKKLKFQAKAGEPKYPPEKSIQSTPEFVLLATAVRTLRNAGRE
jgi:hypothetical protein